MGKDGPAKRVILAQNRRVNCCVVKNLQQKPNRIINFATNELTRYLSKICGSKVNIAKE